MYRKLRPPNFHWSAYKYELLVFTCLALRHDRSGSNSGIIMPRYCNLATVPSHRPPVRTRQPHSHVIPSYGPWSFPRDSCLEAQASNGPILLRFYCLMGQQVRPGWTRTRVNMLHPSFDPVSEFQHVRSCFSLVSVAVHIDSIFSTHIYLFSYRIVNFKRFVHGREIS